MPASPCRLIAFPIAMLLASASLAQAPPLPGGELRIVGQAAGEAPVCPLKYTDVRADVAGFVARVNVKQVFHNPTDRKIEAVYVFPLPQDAAVDDMVMVVGDRVVRGQIKERDEAREIYEQARDAGFVASLLEQERPNIFMQSVANIEPGVEVSIEISYVETLKFDEGVFEWVFPMVVGPRYIPGGGSAPAPMTNGEPTEQVPDADRITPPVTPPGTRAGHDISLTVRLDTGLELNDLESVLHEVEVTRDGPGRATVTLKNQTELPNRDFVLRYRLAGEQIGDAFLVHEDERGRFFTLVLQPPQRVAPAQVVPRELIFVLDTSGSMNGFPMEKSKALMMRMVETMQPSDTFNIITFAGRTAVLWEQPRPATRENIGLAQDFLATLKGGGGTEMMKAIHAALSGAERVSTQYAAPPLRIVCFLTDGYVGNDMEIIGAVKEFAGTSRVFSFGIGNSVNRFLLDGLALAGRGEVEYVTLETEGDPAVQRFHERVLAPVLTDIRIDWGDLPVSEVYPPLIPDLFSAKPIMVHGRLTGPAEGTIGFRGWSGAGPYADTIDVNWPQQPPDHDMLASLWARAKVAHLMLQDYAGLQNGSFPAELKQQIIDLGLGYRLMTQFTSFVAVEEMTVTAGGEAVKIQVPVEMPAGVSYEGIFGDAAGARGRMAMSGAAAANQKGVALGRPATARGAVVASPPPAPQQSIFGQGGSQNQDQAALDAGEPPTTQALLAMRLAEPLHDLAAKVAKEGQNGNLTLGKLKVVDYRVDVMVFFVDLSADTLKALQELGFEQTGESKTARLLIGRIDVRKLEALAQLDAVMHVKPVTVP